MDKILKDNGEEDIMDDNSKAIFVKVSNLLRYNKFCSYADIFNIHIIEDGMYSSNCGI